MATDLEDRLTDGLRQTAEAVGDSPRLDRLIAERLHEPVRPSRAARGPVAVAMAGLAAVVAAALLARAPQVDPPPPLAGWPVQSSIAERTGASLFVAAEDGRAVLIDVDGRAAEPVDLPDGVVRDQVVAVGDAVVVVLGPPGTDSASGDAGTAYAVRPGRGGPPVSLGPATGAVASATPGRVWLRMERVGTETVREAAVDGSPRPDAPVALPARTRLVGAAGEVLVLAGLAPHGRGLAEQLRLFHPKTGASTSLGATSRLVAVHGTTVAWVGGVSPVESSLHLTDVATNAPHRVVARPDATAAFAAGGAFSPDGRTLAAFAVVQPESDPTAVLVLVDAPSGTARVVAGSTFDVGESMGHATWSPSGRWVFFNQFRTRVLAAGRDGRYAGDLRLPLDCRCWEGYAAVR